LKNKRKRSQEAEERREWLGDWDPEAFDLKEAQKEFNI
jgi:hypothetical protein